MLEANTFRAGDEYFSAGDERIEKVHSNFSHTHTDSLVYTRLQLATTDFQAEFMLRWLYIATYLGNGRYHVSGIQKVYSYLPWKWTLSRFGDPKGI